MDKIALSVREIDAKLASLPGGGALPGPHEEANEFSVLFPPFFSPFLLSVFLSLKKIFLSPGKTRLPPPPHPEMVCASRGALRGT